MRGIVFSLATVMSVGIAVAGSRVIEADRASHGRPVTEPDAPSAVSPAGQQRNACADHCRPPARPGGRPCPLPIAVRRSGLSPSGFFWQTALSSP
jgi:hypothetical protein